MFNWDDYGFYRLRLQNDSFTHLSEKRKKRGVEWTYQIWGSGMPDTTISTNDPRPLLDVSVRLILVVSKIYQISDFENKS